MLIQGTIVAKAQTNHALEAKMALHSPHRGTSKPTSGTKKTRCGRDCDGIRMRRLDGVIDEQSPQIEFIRNPADHYCLDDINTRTPLQVAILLTVSLAKFPRTVDDAIG